MNEEFYRCRHCKTKFRVSFWRKRFPSRCPSCGKFTLFKPVMVKVVSVDKIVNAVDDSQFKIFSCFSCFHVWKDKRTLEYCPQCKGYNIYVYAGVNFWTKINNDSLTYNDYEQESKRRPFGRLFYFHKEKKKYCTRCSSCGKTTYVSFNRRKSNKSVNVLGMLSGIEILRQVKERI